MTDYYKIHPDQEEKFGEYRGSYIPPDLQEEMNRITDAYYSISKLHQFISELRSAYAVAYAEI